MITKVFKSGNSQAVRIPQEFQIPDKEVEILERGDELVIRPCESKARQLSLIFWRDLKEKAIFSVKNSKSRSVTGELFLSASHVLSLKAVVVINNTRV
jgi:virulence-associated protein VagC